MVLLLSVTAYHAAVVAPSASDTFAGQSLVEEIHVEREREATRQRGDRRRKVRNGVIVVLLATVALAAIAVGVKRVLDTRRIERALASATQPLAASSSVELEAALTLLESNLRVESDHPQTLGRIAQVRAHQYVRGFVERETALAAANLARDAGRAEGPLAAGMIAAFDGDFDQARRAYEAAPVQDPLIAADAAWLRGVVALGHPYDVALEEGAAERLREEFERQPWALNLRVAARLAARGGDLERALSLTERARELAPHDVGLSVDEALFKALKAEAVEGVLKLVTMLDEGGAVQGPDVARLRLAEGLARLHQGQLEEGAVALLSAWDDLPPADNDNRTHVIEGLLSSGQLDRVDALREDEHLGSQADGLFDAWADLARGESKTALARLEQMPQELPRVAHLQALALTEVYRYPEAQRWVDYARKRLPDRPDLRVAAARVAIGTQSEPDRAREELATLAEQHPWTYRVWTGLAEARLAVPQRSDAQTQEALRALERAIEREQAPAEAAYLLARHHAARIFDDPEAAAIALENYKRASQTPPRSGVHRAAYGAFLGQVARAREAKTVLLELVDDASLGPSPLIELARVVTTDASLRGTPVGEDVIGWLDLAAQRGAEASTIELERARYELARRNPQALERGRRRLEALLIADPQNIDVRALLGRTLLALGDSRAAKVTLRAGIRRTLRVVDGRLYVVLARAELADGKKRRAASLAYKGWRKMVREPLPVGALLDTAPFVAKLWTDLGQPKAAGTIGRGLTFRAPVSPRAWVLRGEIELADERAGAACRSADKAVELDEKLPAAWALRGGCLLAIDANDKALESYERAVKLSEGTVSQKDMEAKLDRARRRAKRR